MGLYIHDTDASVVSSILKQGLMPRNTLVKKKEKTPWGNVVWTNKIISRFPLKAYIRTWSDYHYPKDATVVFKTKDTTIHDDRGYMFPKIPAKDIIGIIHIHKGKKAIMYSPSEWEEHYKEYVDKQGIPTKGKSMKSIQYKGALYVSAEEKTPAWKPGDKVPEGYKVVFGKLRKSKLGQHDIHRHSTMAWNDTHAANQHPLGSRESISAHHAAHAAHADAYLSNLQHAKGTSSPEKKKGFQFAATQHKKAAEDHYKKHLESHEARMLANPKIDRKLNPPDSNELPDIEKIVKEQKLS